VPPCPLPRAALALAVAQKGSFLLKFNRAKLPIFAQQDAFLNKSVKFVL
jgi:hypothetical protein